MKKAIPLLFSFLIGAPCVVISIWTIVDSWSYLTSSESAPEGTAFGFALFGVVPLIIGLPQIISFICKCLAFYSGKSGCAIVAVLFDLPVMSYAIGLYFSALAEAGFENSLLLLGFELKLVLSR